jgi:hypothetical protein
MSTKMNQIQRMNMLSVQEIMKMANPIKRRVASLGFCETLATSTNCVHLSLRQLRNTGNHTDLETLATTQT